MKAAMRVTKPFKKMLRLIKPQADAQPAPGESPPPKNGPLTLATGASIILMLVLAFTSLRLIRDPSIACKVFRPSASAPTETLCPVAPDPLSVSPEKKPPCTPPEVTFYNKLTAPDDPKPSEGISLAGKTPETAPASDSHETTHTSPPAKKEENRPGSATTLQSGPASPPRPSHVPKSERGTRTYTVQVGAFSHPGIAQQWADKWKARGFDVTLKPVARPRTGVIYRLYLGNFLSEKKADELVERLKTKEGISAFRLVVQN